MKHLIGATALMIATAVPAAAEVVSKIAPASVAETMDKLVAAVEGAGATVFARVDHAAGAQSVDMELPPAQLLIFGNPALGTPAMQDDPLAGLALPLRVLVFEAEDGRAVVAWEPPTTFLDGLTIPEDAEYVGKMTAALDRLTDAAVAE
ncbi:DUF302 domain-containing protein [Pseudooctadecabacter sp.]|uniref:DUF302 domain-containing protein n=1 Tax=Pseudooctadecabacter sp. TaxID=1966338 RepID=UPI0025F7156D|nr:DUF302 domain-containing protein [Pseudooctadecabacter sp.]